MIDNTPIHFRNESVIAGSTVRGNGNYAVHTAGNNLELDIVQMQRQSLIHDTDFSGLITLDQTHSDKIHFIGKDNLNRHISDSLIQGDGLLTALPGILLGVLTADCVPVFFSDSKASFCGIVHAGWRGAEKGIHLKMLELIRNKLSISPENVEIAFGPYIQACCYEVGEDLVKDYDRGEFIRKDDKIYLDLEANICNDLIEAGVKRTFILKGSWCTKCSQNPRFYSYRAGDRKDRILSFIGLKE